MTSSTGSSTHERRSPSRGGLASAQGRRASAILRNALLASFAACATSAWALPNLTVTKTANVESVNPQGALTYKISVHNQGTTAANGTIQVTDQLPSAMQFVSVVSDGDLLSRWSCNQANGLVTCTKNSLSAGGQAPNITINVTAGSPPQGSLSTQVTNTAHVSCQQPCVESDTTDNNASVTTTIGWSQLSLHKLADATAAWQGAPYRYSLYVSNASAIPDRSGVSVTDTLPPGITFLHAWGVGWECTRNGQTVTCDREIEHDIPAQIPPSGGTASPISIDVLAPSVSGSVTNTAVLQSDVDATLGDNVDSNVVTVASTSASTDLQLTATASGAPSLPSGAPYSYTFTVKNNGPQLAHDGVTFKAVLPKDITIVDIVENGGWSCSWAAIEFGVLEHLVTCSLPELASGVTASPIAVKVLAGLGGPEMVRAWVAGLSDTNTANNVVDIGKIVVASNAPDLTIDMSSNPAYPIPVDRGAQYTYTTQVKNLGATATSGTLTATQVLPDGVEFVAAMGLWACIENGGTVNCTRSAPLAAGANAPTIAITVIAPNGPKLLSARAVIANTEGDSNPSNNTDEAITRVTNVAPIAIEDVYATPLGTTLSKTAAHGVLANDFDADGDPLVATRRTPPTHGTLTLRDDGGFDYEPESQFEGLDSFTYHATDGGAESSDVTVEIYVGNQPPTLAGQITSVPESAPSGTLVATLSASDDGQLQPIVYAIVGGNVDSAFSINASTGEITVTGALDYEVRPTYALQVSANDGQYNANATVTVDVTDVINGPGVENFAPIAVGDAVQVTPGGTATTLIDGSISVLSNDADQNGDPLHAVLSAVTTSHGTLTFDGQGAFSYQNNANDLAATDSFQYLACDDQNACSTATVNIWITNAPLNHVPMPGDDAIRVQVGHTTNHLESGALSVLSNDPDEDMDALTASVAVDAVHGALTLNADGTFLYAQDSNDPVATDSFTYQVCDIHGACALANVDITVVSNAAPAIQPLALVHISEAANLGAPIATIAATDDGFPESPGALTYAIVAGNSANAFAIASATGAITVNGALDFEVTPSYVLTVQVSDGEASSTVDLVVIVDDVVNGPGVENTAPQAANQAFASVPETRPVGSVVGAVVATDDGLPSGSHLTYTITTVGSPFAINATTGEVTTSAPLDYDAMPVHTLTVRVSDSQLFTDAAITIPILEAGSGSNTPPVAANDTYAAIQDVTLSIGVRGLLANDTDAEGDDLDVQLGSQPQHGELTLGTDGDFIYKPDTGFVGDDSFTYQTSDGTELSNTATVTIAVALQGSGAAPMVADDMFVAVAGTSTFIAPPGVLANDVDSEHDTVLAVAIGGSGPSHGTLSFSSDGSFTYAPDAGFIGTDNFRYFATDGTTDSTPANVEIKVVAAGGGAPPSASNDAYVAIAGEFLVIGARGVLSNDEDADGDTLQSTLVSSAAHGQLVLGDDGAFRYRPNDGIVGTDSFSYHATDGASTSNEAIVTITIAPKGSGQPPLAVDDGYMIPMGHELEILAPGVLANDTDLEDEAMLTSLVAAPAHGVIIFNSDGSFRYMPQPGYSGADSFRYIATDGSSESNVATVSIVVTHLGSGDAPVAVDDDYPAVMNQSLTISAPGVLANDTDTEHDLIFAMLESQPLHGSVALGTDGAFVYQPDHHFTGIDTFTYRASDGNSDSNVATVRITVAGSQSPNAPVAVADTYATPVGQTLNVVASGVLSNDSDEDNDQLSALLVDGTTHGSLSLAEDGGFIYAPDAGYQGNDSFTYQATDGTWNSNIATVTITVGNGGGTNAAPVVGPNPDLSIAESASGGALVGQVIAHDDGLPTGTLTFSITDGNIANAFEIEPSTGRVLVDHGLDFETIATYVLTISVSDGALTGTGTVVVNVTNVDGGPGVENRAPAAVDDAIQVLPLGSATTLVGGAASVLANDSDPDNDALTATAIGEPSAGMLTFAADGTFRYDNTDSSATEDGFDYEVCDTHDACATGHVTITITESPTNHLPSAMGDSLLVAPGGSANVLVGGANSVLANDSDIDHDPLHAVLLMAPVHGDLSLQSDGTFVYKDRLNDPVPQDHFLYQACDTHGACSSAFVFITVSSVLPVINCVLPRQVYEVGDSVVLNLSSMFTPPPGRLLSYSAQNLPPALSVNSNTGMLTGTLTQAAMAGSPYSSRLIATTVPGGASASEFVSFIVLANGEIVLRNGFDLSSTQACH